MTGQIRAAINYPWQSLLWRIGNRSRHAEDDQSDYSSWNYPTNSACNAMPTCWSSLARPSIVMISPFELRRRISRTERRTGCTEMLKRAEGISWLDRKEMEVFKFMTSSARMYCSSKSRLRASQHGPDERQGVQKVTLGSVFPFSHCCCSGLGGLFWIEKTSVRGVLLMKIQLAATYAYDSSFLIMVQ